MQAIGFYMRYLAGQYVGMSEALSMDAVRFACEADMIPVERWAETTEEVLVVHRAVLAHTRAK
jgi:hypothetical protein